MRATARARVLDRRRGRRYYVRMTDDHELDQKQRLRLTQLSHGAG
jgi:hypothetical protein